MMKRKQTSELLRTDTNLQGTGCAGAPDSYETAQEKPMSLRKELLCLLCLLLALVLFCCISIPVLMPKRFDYGSTWGMYEKEPKNSVDVLFFGSSVAYCDVIPAVIYRETGLTSYVMAGGSQTLPITYRYLREACKTQSPQAVVVEVSTMIAPPNNRSIKSNLTFMPWSENRLVPTLEGPLTEGGSTPEETEALEKEARLELLLPLYAYHSRWDELTLQDFQYGLFGYETDPMAGYTFLDRAEPFQDYIFRDAAQEEDYARNLEYAKKIADYCRENEIQLIFSLFPSTNRIDKNRIPVMERDFAEMGGELVNWNLIFTDLGFDLSTDFYDNLHLNYRGAEKFSKELAADFAGRGIAPSGKEDKSLWESRIAAFSELKEEYDSAPVRLIQSSAGAASGEGTQ